MEQDYDYYRWQFLRKNPKYRCEFDGLRIEIDDLEKSEADHVTDDELKAFENRKEEVECLKEMFCKRWSVSKIAGYHLDELPADVSFTKSEADICFTEVFSKNDLEYAVTKGFKEGWYATGEHSIIENLFHHYIDQYDESGRKKYALIAIDLDTLSGKKEEFKKIATTIESKYKEWRSLNNKKGAHDRFKFDTNRFDWLLHVYDFACVVMKNENAVEDNNPRLCSLMLDALTSARTKSKLKLQTEVAWRIAADSKIKKYDHATAEQDIREAIKYIEAAPFLPISKGNNF